MQNEGFRLSPEQRRFWLLQQTGPAHRAQCAVMLEGALEPERLRQAVRRVVDRHEILRTTFPLPPGMKVPYQAVCDGDSPSWQIVDLTALSPEEQNTKLDSLFEEQKKAPFDFEHGPLLQLSLIKLSARRHALLVSLPALCADAVTLGNLIREIAQRWVASDPVQEIRSEPLQYADFAAWQEELLQNNDAEAVSGKQYWSKQDFPSIPPLLLPFVRNGKPTAEFASASFSLQINGDMKARLGRTADACGVSVSTFMLACWQTLLWRLTRQPDIVMATVFDGRTLEELRGALGLFAKSLPVRFRLEADSKFSEIASQVDEALRSAQNRHEYFTPETGVDPAALPIAFEFDEPWSKLEAADVSFLLYKQHVCGDRFAVKLRCINIDDRLTAEFNYDPEKVGAYDVERLAAQFGALLAAALDNPQSRIDDLQILSDVERKRVLVEWNDTRSHFSKDNCVHHLFERQAEEHPSRIALVCEDQQLTYEELNARANQLAHYLQSLGVGPETPVAICIERSLEMIVGLLGVLKAGGAYVPLDPVLPRQRLSFMLQETRAPVLLTCQKLVEGLPKYAGWIICLDTDWEVIAKESPAPTSDRVTSQNLAYVLFTSGSTGTPKGVAVEHGQLLNYLHGILKRLDLPSGASFATVSTFAADLGNTAIFPSLCTGGQLHVISQERASDADSLANYFAGHPIDCLKIVPSHLEALLDRAHPEEILPRKRLVLGGEPARWELIRKVQRLAPDCITLNHYGPTETTVGVSTYRAETVMSECHSETPPIGRPIANTQIYLLDRYLRPVPIWAPGELYIGGFGITRGYFNCPELTAEQFIPDPFAVEAGARLYRTGDRCRYLPDGNIEFLGRVDNQVKIRGFRIELGEIEAALNQHPAVQKAVVVTREETVTGPSTSLGTGPSTVLGTGKRLVAYVVFNRNLSLSTSELRNLLKEKLPEHMVPSVFVALNALPLTPNGKIDRRALPAPDQSRPELTETFVPPRTSTEKSIATTWAEILKMTKIGVNDNFFEIGGHSLLATQVISRIRSAFSIEIPLRSLFEHPTVAGLAEAVVRSLLEKEAAYESSDTLSGIESLSDEEVELLLSDKTVQKI